VGKSTRVRRTRKEPPDWVPPVEYLNDLGGYAREPIEFTERQLRLIQTALPSSTDPKRKTLLPFLLREWARVELREWLSGIPLSALAKQRKRLGTVAKNAAALIQALQKLNALDRWALVDQLGIAEGLTGHKVFRNEKNRRRVNRWYDLTTTIGAAAAGPMQKPSRGRPRNDPAQLVLMDLAALFAHLTGLRASRVVPRTGEDAGKESGPFLEFARALWPVIFTQGDEGLESQLREWADLGSKTSPLIYSIASRNPEWGIISKR